MQHNLLAAKVLDLHVFKHSLHVTLFLIILYEHMDKSKLLYRIVISPICFELDRNVRISTMMVDPPIPTRCCCLPRGKSLSNISCNPQFGFGFDPPGFLRAPTLLLFCHHNQSFWINANIFSCRSTPLGYFCPLERCIRGATTLCPWKPRLLTAIVNRGRGLSYFHVIWFVTNSIERYGVSVRCSLA